MSRTPERSTPAGGAIELLDQPATGRVFRTQRRVSIADASPSGRMESDAIARFLQDVGNDDTDDAGLAELGLAWVARKTVIEVRAPAEPRELLDLATWCSGTGWRWAERRTTLSSERGARIDAASIWVHLDPSSGRPTPWGQQFADAYLPSTDGRQVDAKLRHPKSIPDGLRSSPWHFRQSDMDGFGHVNNAAYLAIAEQHLSSAELNAAHRIEVEWRGACTADDELDVVESDTPRQLWLVERTTGEVRVTLSYAALPR